MTRQEAVTAALWALGLALPLSIAATNAALGALCALVLAGLVSGRGARVPSAPALWALAAYASVGVLVALGGVEPLRSLREAAKDWHKPWSLAVLLAALAAAPRAKPERALAAGFSCAAAIGLWQSATLRAGDSWLRAHAFVHPVTYGDMMATAVLGGLCFWNRREAGLESRRGRLAACAFLVVCGAALILNQTRGAILGLLAGFAAVCLLDKRLRRWALPLAGALLAAGVVWQLLPHEANADRSLGALLRLQLRRADGQYNPALARFELWGVAWRIFRDHPLFGVGPGNYNTEFARYFSGRIDNQIVWGSAHNLFLQQLAERGLAGFAALSAALAVLVGRAFSRARRNPDAWSLWAWGAWVSFLVMNLTEVAFQTELTATFFLFIWAGAEAAQASAPRG